jgi:hypothetical protein
MTKTLEKAIERLRQLPEDSQEAIAKLLLHEIDEDERWMHSTEAHAGNLKRFVDDILEADRRGECEPLDPDQL